MSSESFEVIVENTDAQTELEDASSHRKKSKSTPKSGKARRWLDSEVDDLIDELEQKTCLWDVASKDYHLRNKRVRAYQEMQDKLDINIADIKAKITSLRSQLGREIAKVKAKKSGQATSDNYKPSWPYWDQLKFLANVMQAGQSKDTLPSRTSTPDSMEDEMINAGNDDGLDLSQEEQDISSPVVETPTRPTKSRKRNAEQELKTKQELLETCIQVLKEPVTQPEPKTQCTFSLYVAERLQRFDRRTRMLAEKRINDILFDLEMNIEHQSLQQSWQPAESSRSVAGGSYMDMLQNSQPMYR